MLQILGPRARHAVGVDISVPALRLARTRIHGAGLSHCEFRRGDMYSLPYDDASFDTVSIDRVLAAAERPAAAIAEAARTLRPDGRLIVIEDFDQIDARASDNPLSQLRRWFAAAGHEHRAAAALRSCRPSFHRRARAPQPAPATQHRSATAGRSGMNSASLVGRIGNGLSKLARPVQVSFEFFPPGDAQMEQTLWQSIQRLAPLRPRFVSVTYGADGSTRERTHKWCRAWSRKPLLTPAAHLTCVGMDRAHVLEIARSYWHTGVRHIVALRGDAPQGSSALYALSGRLCLCGGPGARPAQCGGFRDLGGGLSGRASRTRRMRPSTWIISRPSSTPAPIAPSRSSSSSRAYSCAFAIAARPPASRPAWCPASCRSHVFRRCCVSPSAAARIGAGLVAAALQRAGRRCRHASHDRRGLCHRAGGGAVARRCR